MIKKISLIATLFLAVYLPMKAQGEKFLIGGKMGFSYFSENPVSSPDVVQTSKVKTVSFSGAPVFGYFLTQNLMAGIDFEFAIEHSNIESGLLNKTQTKSLTLNPLVRIYFNSPFFMEARFTWGINTITYELKGSHLPEEDYKNKSKTLGGGAGLGYDIKLADKVSLEPLIYYRWNTYKIDKLDTKSNQSHLFINLGLVFKI